MAVVDNLTSQDFTMRSGDTKALTVTVTDGSSNAKDLSGAQAIVWQLACRKGATNQVSKTLGSGITNSDPTNGRFTISLSPSDTASLDGSYYHEAQVTDGAGNVETVMVGVATIIGDHVE